MRAIYAAVVSCLVRAALALPYAPRQAAPLPFVGAPAGDLFRSHDELTCDVLRISFGGGDGPPYSVSFVTPPPSHNASLDEVEVLERVGVLGMSGVVYFDMDSSNLTAGAPVALQVIDGAGQVGYSVNRHVREARLNEYCHLPGAFWPPSRWDGTHFSILLIVLFLGGPFSIGFLTSFKQEWIKARAAARVAAAESRAADVPLQDRATHVLGEGEDDDRTSLGDEDRPLLRAEGTAHAPDTAPPGYEEAIKEDRRSGEETRL